ncbi:unnamed protein product [Amoebophrya sp. A120]|nr:unnamed protein product [Amoebophrya sp. A120]|eukprot:GSA120T00018967001.1
MQKQAASEEGEQRRLHHALEQRKRKAEQEESRGSQSESRHVQALLQKQAAHAQRKAERRKARAEREEATSRREKPTLHPAREQEAKAEVEDPPGAEEGVGLHLAAEVDAEMLDEDADEEMEQDIDSDTETSGTGDEADIDESDHKVRGDSASLDPDDDFPSDTEEQDPALWQTWAEFGPQFFHQTVEYYTTSRDLQAVKQAIGTASTIGDTSRRPEGSTSVPGPRPAEAGTPASSESYVPDVPASIHNLVAHVPFNYLQELAADFLAVLQPEGLSLPAEIASGDGGGGVEGLPTEGEGPQGTRSTNGVWEDVEGIIDSFEQTFRTRLQKGTSESRPTEDGGAGAAGRGSSDTEVVDAASTEGDGDEFMQDETPVEVDPTDHPRADHPPDRERDAEAERDAASSVESFAPAPSPHEELRWSRAFREAVRTWLHGDHPVFHKVFGDDASVTDAVRMFVARGLEKPKRIISKWFAIKVLQPLKELNLRHEQVLQNQAAGNVGSSTDVGVAPSPAPPASDTASTTRTGAAGAPVEALFLKYADLVAKLAFVYAVTPVFSIGNDGDDNNRPSVFSEVETRLRERVRQAKNSNRESEHDGRPAGNVHEGGLSAVSALLSAHSTWLSLYWQNAFTTHEGEPLSFSAVFAALIPKWVRERWNAMGKNSRAHDEDAVGEDGAGEPEVEQEYRPFATLIFLVDEVLHGSVARLFGTDPTRTILGSFLAMDQQPTGDQLFATSASAATKALQLQSLLQSEVAATAGGAAAGMEGGPFASAMGREDLHGAFEQDSQFLIRVLNEAIFRRRSEFAGARTLTRTFAEAARVVKDTSDSSAEEILERWKAIYERVLWSSSTITAASAGRDAAASDDENQEDESAQGSTRFPSSHTNYLRAWEEYFRDSSVVDAIFGLVWQKTMRDRVYTPAFVQFQENVFALVDKGLKNKKSDLVPSAPSVTTISVITWVHKVATLVVELLQSSRADLDAAAAESRLATKAFWEEMRNKYRLPLANLLQELDVAYQAKLSFRWMPTMLVKLNNFHNWWTTSPASISQMGQKHWQLVNTYLLGLRTHLASKIVAATKHHFAFRGSTVEQWLGLTNEGNLEDKQVAEILRLSGKPEYEFALGETLLAGRSNKWLRDIWEKSLRPWAATTLAGNSRLFGGLLQRAKRVSEYVDAAYLSGTFTEAGGRGAAFAKRLHELAHDRDVLERVSRTGFRSLPASEKTAAREALRKYGAGTSTFGQPQGAAGVSSDSSYEGLGSTAASSGTESGAASSSASSVFATTDATAKRKVVNKAEKKRLRAAAALEEQQSSGAGVPGAAAPAAGKAPAGVPAGARASPASASNHAQKAVGEGAETANAIALAMTLVKGKLVDLVWSDVARLPELFEALEAIWGGTARNFFSFTLLADFFARLSAAERLQNRLTDWIGWNAVKNRLGLENFARFLVRKRHSGPADRFDLVSQSLPQEYDTQLHQTDVSSLFPTVINVPRGSLVAVLDENAADGRNSRNSFDEHEQFMRRSALWSLFPEHMLTKAKLVCTLEDCTVAAITPCIDETKKVPCFGLLASKASLLDFRPQTHGSVQQHYISPRTLTGFQVQSPALLSLHHTVNLSCPPCNQLSLVSRWLPPAVRENARRLDNVADRASKLFEAVAKDVFDNNSATTCSSTDGNSEVPASASAGSSSGSRSSGRRGRSQGGTAAGQGAGTDTESSPSSSSGSAAGLDFQALFAKYSGDFVDLFGHAMTAFRHLGSGFSRWTSPPSDADAAMREHIGRFARSVNMARNSYGITDEDADSSSSDEDSGSEPNVDTRQRWRRGQPGTGSTNDVIRLEVDGETIELPNTAGVFPDFIERLAGLNLQP